MSLTPLQLPRKFNGPHAGFYLDELNKKEDFLAQREAKLGTRDRKSAVRSHYYLTACRSPMTSVFSIYTLRAVSASNNL